MSALSWAWFWLRLMKSVRSYSPREMRDMRVVDVIGKVVLGQLSWLEAQRVLGYSSRHMLRLRERLEIDGASGLVDRRSGRAMPSRVAAATQAEILRLREKVYFDFTVKHFNESLVEKHKLVVSYTYTKSLLQQSGLAEVGRARGRKACRSLASCAGSASE